MRPPYDPAHPEVVKFPRSAVQSSGTDTGHVVAACGDHFVGPPRALGRNDTARLLADDLNAHRATYVPAG